MEQRISTQNTRSYLSPIALTGGGYISLESGGGSVGAVAYTGSSTGDLVTLGIRPEHLTLEACGNLALEGKVESVERMGDITYLYLSIAGGKDLVTISQQGDWEIALDQTIKVYADSEKPHLFDQAGKVLAKTVK